MDKESIITELLTLGWSRQTLAVWLRADCKCEYCGCDLLASDDQYFYGSHVDHIVPGAGDDLENLALACKTCNFIKRAKKFAEAAEVLDRQTIVGRAQAFILARREENQERLRHVKVLIESHTGRVVGSVSKTLNRAG